MNRLNSTGGRHGGRISVLASGICVAMASPVFAAVAPYTPDAHTLGLYHFDESAGATDPGNPIVNHGTAGAALNMTNTGGPDGRNNATDGGYGAAAYDSSFGSAFDVLASGNGAYSAGPNPFSGGVRTAGAVTQASLQGDDGAFTYEGLINISTLSEDQILLSHDGAMDGATLARGFMLRISGGLLSFYHGAGSVTAALPDAGPHAFAPNTWFHFAVTYTGAEGVADNLTFYWTALDSGATQANAVGTATLAADLGSSADGNWLGIGTGTRGEFRNQIKGFVDEVRISSIARGADDFLFAVPEPASLSLLALGGLLVAGRRRG